MTPQSLPPRRWLRLLALTIPLGALAVAVIWLNLGRWLERPAGPPADTDVIVLLGGNSDARLVAGLELYLQGRAPRIFLAGVEARQVIDGQLILEPRLNVLRAAGVPDEAIFMDTVSSNSWEEAASTLALMLQEGWRKALVVSDPPHMRRLSLIWRQVFDRADASYALVASDPKWWRSQRWWRDKWARQFVHNEVLRLGYYYVLRRWPQRRPPVAPHRDERESSPSAGEGVFRHAATATHAGATFQPGAGGAGGVAFVGA